MGRAVLSCPTADVLLAGMQLLCGHNTVTTHHVDVLRQPCLRVQQHSRRTMLGAGRWCAPVLDHHPCAQLHPMPLACKQLLLTSSERPARGCCFCCWPPAWLPAGAAGSVDTLSAAIVGAALRCCCSCVCLRPDTGRAEACGPVASAAARHAGGVVSTFVAGPQRAGSRPCHPRTPTGLLLLACMLCCCLDGALWVVWG